MYVYGNNSYLFNITMQLKRYIVMYYYICPTYMCIRMYVYYIYVHTLGRVKHFQFAVKILHQSITLLWTMVFRINKCSCVITQVWI